MEAGLRSLSPSAAARPRRPLLERAFLEHPRGLGESYWQHQQRALGFGTEMIVGGIACVIHALVPALFERTASTTVVRLTERMRATHRLSR
jgi:hypothetical protein